MDLTEYKTKEMLEEESVNNKTLDLKQLRIRSILSSEGMTEIMMLLLGATNFNGVNLSTDPIEIAQSEARRSVFSEMLATLEDIDPTYYPRFLLTIAEDMRDE